MFGIGMQELVLIFVIALIVVGPKQLPELAKALGKGYAEFRRAFDEMKGSVERELRADEIRRTLADLPGGPPAPPPERRPPSGDEARTPYPEIVDAPAPEGDEPPAAGAGDDRERARD